MLMARGRDPVLAEGPAADVDDVDAVVPHLAVAGVPEPVPFVVQLLAPQRPHRRRAAPEVVIQGPRRRGGCVDRADAVAGPIHQSVGEADRPELAASEAVEHAAEEAAGAVLGADLDHPAVLAGRRHHLPPFPDVIGERLLDVHVLPRLTRPDRRQRVPVVRQGDDHRVDALVVEDLAGVAIRGDLRPEVAGRLDFPVEVRRVGVAERDDVGAGDLAEPADELMSPPAHTPDGRGRAQPDDPDIHRVVGADRSAPGAEHQPRHPHRQAGRHRTPQEAPARDRFHHRAHLGSWGLWRERTVQMPPAWKSPSQKGTGTGPRTQILRVKSGDGPEPVPFWDGLQG